MDEIVQLLLLLTHWKWLVQRDLGLNARQTPSSSTWNDNCETQSALLSHVLHVLLTSFIL